MSTAVGHGLAGPKRRSNYFEGQLERLCQKGIRLIFLSYMLWRLYGNVINIGYRGWDC